MSSQGVRNTKRRRRRPMLTKQTSPSDALRRHFLSLPLLLAHLPPFCHSFSISQLNSSQFKSRPTLYDHWPIHLNSKSKQQQHLTSILISLSFIPFLLLFKIEFHQLSNLYHLFDLLSLWFFLQFFFNFMFWSKSSLFLYYRFDLIRYFWIDSTIYWSKIIYY